RYRARPATYRSSRSAAAPMPAGRSPSRFVRSAAFNSRSWVPGTSTRTSWPSLSSGRQVTMTEDYDTAEGPRQRADSVAAAEAFARGDATLDFGAAGTVELPPTPEGEVMVVRSIRLPADLEVRAKGVAEARGVPYSALIRDWIADGLERAEAGE